MSDRRRSDSAVERFDCVGPVLAAGPVAEAVLAALQRRNDRLQVVNHGAYLRALVPERCRLVRADVEELLGRSFTLPRELEEVMPSFKGRLEFTPEGAEWAFGSLPRERTVP